MQEKTNLKIDWATHEAAKYACENFHYSRCIPKNKLLKIGAWENDKFIGVVIFSYGATNNLGKPYGLTMQQCCELTRVALNKHKTPVSKILSIAIRFLKKSNPGVEMIVSFADTNQGHMGTIYQATNWIYNGMTSEAIFYRDPKGKLWHPRRASKNSVPGKKLVTNDWKCEVQKGKHRYLYPLTDKMRVQLEKLRKPYPKKILSVSSVEASTSGFHPEGGGASPTDTVHLKETGL